MYKNFEHLMQVRGLTSYKVCKDTGVAQATLSRWKNGKSEPSLDTMRILAGYFGVSVDYLLGKGSQEGKIDTSSQLGMDDFTYAMYNETKQLTAEQKDTLLGMARYFRQQLQEKKE